MDVVKNNDRLIAARVVVNDCYTEVTPMPEHETTHGQFRIWQGGMAYGTLTINATQAREMSEMFAMLADWLTD